MAWKAHIKDAQRINLLLLKKMEEVCKKYEITYFLDFGALLGAVRHHDFIPWDDDVDITMTRPEFEKLKKVPCEEWGEDFALVGYDELSDGNYFLDYIPRLIYLKEDIEIDTYDKLGNHLNPAYKNKMPMDIFILDYAYDSHLRQALLVKEMTLFYGLAMGHRGYMDYSEYQGVSKLVVKMLAGIGRLLPLSWINRQYEKCGHSVKKAGKQYFYYNNALIELHNCVDRSFFRKAVPLETVNGSFLVPAEYEKLLCINYGDYMQLPPEKERRPKHLRDN